MAGVFESITLSWDGAEYPVPADKVMGLIASIEEVLTLSEIHAFSVRGGAPLARLAQAYGRALRYAGAKFSDEEVYSGFFGQHSEQNVTVIINSLLLMMVPPQRILEVAKGQAAKKRPAASNSSRARTSPRSERAG